MDESVPQSPLWWVKRLAKALNDRRQDVDRFVAYYEGTPPIEPWLPQQAQEEFHRLLRLTKSNYMGLVVDATAERMQVEGFRLGDSPQADKETWKIWQANNLDNDSDQAILDALITGYGYTLVAPGEGGSGAQVFVESPQQAVVAYEPGYGRRRRAAGLKIWIDDWTNYLCATLYLPGNIFKFQSDQPGARLAMTSVTWKPREVRGEQFGAVNPLKAVPLVELCNNPRTLYGGTSELADVTSIQDRIGKTLADRMMTQDYGAFPQKWAIGFPETDGEGNPNKVDVGRNRLIRSDIAETKFGQFDAAPLDPYSTAKREDVKDIASRTRTPAQYLLGEMSNVNGETLKAAESGLVSKVRQRMRSLGEGFEETMRLARQASGMPAGDESMETIWRNPEFRTEGELVDALTKMATLGVPEEALWERWGASQAEISRWKRMRAERDVAGVAQLLKQPPTPQQPVGPVSGAPAA